VCISVLPFERFFSSPARKWEHGNKVNFTCLSETDIVNIETYYNRCINRCLKVMAAQMMSQTKKGKEEVFWPQPP
jgi:hypothetical protein